jgi:hypothetical protein
MNSNVLGVCGVQICVDYFEFESLGGMCSVKYSCMLVWPKAKCQHRVEKDPFKFLIPFNIENEAR